MLKVAIYQGGHREGVEANLSLMESTIHDHSNEGIDLIVFSETFLTGYCIGEELRLQSEKRDGPSFQKVSEISKKYKIGIVYGYPERTDVEGEFFNSCMFVSKSGKELSNYRKMHCWGAYEKTYFQNYDKFSPIVEFEGWKIGTLICYDVEFPETCRVLCLSGAELLLVPTALCGAFNAKVTVVSRAFENGCFLCYANRVGVEHCPDLKRDLTFCGLSVIVAPWGEELRRASATKSELIIAELRKDDKYFEALKVNPYFEDRRPELYSKLTQLKKTSE